MNGREEAMLRFMRLNPPHSGSPASSTQSRGASAYSAHEELDIQSSATISSQLQVTQSRLQALSEELANSEAASEQKEFLGRSALQAA